MTLVDAGPLIALIDKGQGEAHEKCIAAQKVVVGSLLTTWPCLAEAMYLLGELGGWQGQEALWRFVEKEALIVHGPGKDETTRMRSLMEKYRDTPMDLADASLVALAEARGLKRIFTLDSDFYVYRISDLEPFEVFPSG
ncbi:MAG TPA: PIN domain-containing protein [Blastocatellia bacterium]|nr:PIN domain-containing protein [Blastocatellia bacterium]